MKKLWMMFTFLSLAVAGYCANGQAGSEVNADAPATNGLHLCGYFELRNRGDRYAGQRGLQCAGCGCE